jgi:hypothetical protein
VASGSAQASCPADPSVNAPLVDAKDPATRHAFIRARMEVGARRARAWSLAWGVTYGAAAVAQLTAAPFVSPDTRKDLYVGASSALLGASIRTFAVPRVIRERRRLARRADTDPCAALQAAEQAMARSAKSEAFGHSLWLHLGALVYNAGIGVVLGVALHRPVSGARQASIGATVGQIMILTQPTTMLRALDEYRHGRLSGPQRGAFVPLVLPGGAGVGFVLHL